MISTFIKDPNAIQDFNVDWTDALEGDTISSSSWTVPAGITQTSDFYTGTVATIWLSGGTAGTSYELTNRIVTAAGRTDDQTIKIRCFEL